MKHKPHPDVYALKREALAHLEALCEQGCINLLYGDENGAESRVSLLPCIPYGWQFKDEQIVMPSQQGGGVNCFAWISRNSDCQAFLTPGQVTAQRMSMYGCIDILIHSKVCSFGIARCACSSCPQFRKHSTREVSARDVEAPTDMNIMKMRRAKNIGQRDMPSK